MKLHRSHRENQSKMFLQLCIMSLYLVQGLTDGMLGCKTPHGEPGQCIPITSCPVLFEAFTNPVKGSEDLLRQFNCESEKYVNEAYYGPTVCCGTISNFTIYSKNVSSNKSRKQVEFPAKTYCGLQHRDDYYSSDESIAIDEFPWMAAIIGHYPGMINYTLCSGALINNRYVLTSAECLLPTIGEGGPTLFVRLGDFHIGNGTDCVELKRYDSSECSTAEDYLVEEKIVHLLYTPYFFNNIALLRLAKSLTYSEYIRPICLPVPGTTLAQPNDTLYISGLGQVQGDEIKKKLSIKLISNDECKQKLGEGWYYVNPNVLCTTSISKYVNLTCHGDEGAPLMASHKHQWHIEGIVQRSYCSFSEVFDDLLVYTRVSQYLEWMKNNMRP